MLVQEGRVASGASGCNGQSLRALDRANVILVAPSRCGKAPTTMYLALQHGLFVANYLLLDEDLVTVELPRPDALRPHTSAALSLAEA